MTLNAPGAGLGSTFAMIEETSFGQVVVTPAWKFYEPSAVNWKKIKTTKQSSGFAGGRIVDALQRRVVVERAGSATSTFEVMQSGGFTRLLNLLSSSYAAGAAGSQAIGQGIYSAGARLQPAAPCWGYSHTFRNSIAGRSCALQCGAPDTTGILRQADLLGVKPTKVTFACKAGEFLTMAVDWDARILEDPMLTASYEGYPNGAGQTPYVQAAPSYSVQLPFHFAQAQIQVGASTAAASSAALVDGVTEWTLTIENKLNTNRQYYGNAGLKDEQLRNDLCQITGTIVSDYVNKATWADPFYSETPQSVLVTFAAGALAGTTPAVQFALNNVLENDATPAPSNKDIISTTFPYQAFYDQTNEPLSVFFQTTDATG